MVEEPVAESVEEQEEEEMTRYTEEEIKESWEFKIVRSNTGAFSNPATLRKLIEEEALSGWVMLEKFDDARVRRASCECT